ncbi:MAG: adenosylhomocysteinase, partial [Exiguobacterium sp.]|nr:adenosylhomocysteinase [Exiguobacterium sp.]
GSNPLSTQDDVAAALVHDGLNVFAWHGATAQEYHQHISEVVKIGPNIIIEPTEEVESKECEKNAA